MFTCNKGTSKIIVVMQPASYECTAGLHTLIRVYKLTMRQSAEFNGIIFINNLVTGFVARKTPRFILEN